jgi:hypothetical protein
MNFFIFQCSNRTATATVDHFHDEITTHDSRVVLTTEANAIATPAQGDAGHSDIARGG